MKLSEIRKKCIGKTIIEEKTKSDYMNVNKE